MNIAQIRSDGLNILIVRSVGSCFYKERTKIEKI